MAVNEQTINEILKEVWADGAPKDTTFQNHPFMGLVKKSTNRIVGEYFVLPIQYGHIQAVTPNIANSITRAATAQERFKQFQIPRVVLYNTALIDGVTAKISKGNKAAAAEAITVAMDGSTAAMGHAISTQLFRSGYGAAGTIGSTTNLSSKIIKLANVEDARNFEVDMQIVFAQSESGHVLRDTGDYLTLTAVDYDTGELTTDAPTDLSTSIALIASGDTIFPKDWRENSATPTRKVAFGTAAWVPAIAPTSTTFCGVDRSVNPTRLGGMRLDNTTENRPLDEFLRRMCAKAYRLGKKIDHIFLNPERWQDLADLRDSMRPVVLKSGDADIGYDALEMSSLVGKVMIVPEPDCPTDRVMGLNLSTWELMSVDDLIHVIDDDGKWAQRSSNADALEVRFRSIFNLGCMDPSSNIYGKLA
jgi:hypothetical protein